MNTIFKNRLDQLSSKLHDIGYNGFYINNLTNIRYLTGFTGSAALLLVIDGIGYFFTDGRYIKQSSDQVQNCDITIIDSNYFDAINKKKIFKKNNLKIAFEGNHISYSNYNGLLKIFSHIDWIPTYSIIENIASIKDKHEIESLKTAIEITDYTFTKIIPEIKMGVSEQQISAKISYLFKMNGAEGDSYDSIIASGPNAALPHARPTNRKFKKGDFIVMDFGALYNGYHADMTRTVLIGPAIEKHKEIYNIVLKSQLNGISVAKANVSCSSVDQACRSIIDQHGYAKFFNHSTGHGIGLEVHTLPRIHKNNNELLKPNHIITIEPGIYLPDWGGVRIEDDCLITKDQCLPLNKSTKELIII